MAIEEVGRHQDSKRWMTLELTVEQEFSIEIPDKEADQIHSGKRTQDPIKAGCLRGRY